VSGFGKTFGLNCYLTREYAENGIPFDLLEPMGHGRILFTDAFRLNGGGSRAIVEGEGGVRCSTKNS
jgi:hypothetical protein